MPSHGQRSSAPAFPQLAGDSLPDREDQEQRKQREMGVDKGHFLVQSRIKKLIGLILFVISEVDENDRDRCKHIQEDSLGDERLEGPPAYACQVLKRYH